MSEKFILPKEYQKPTNFTATRAQIAMIHSK